MEKFLYGEMTWPEAREAARQGRVAVVPVATIEDHGYHLPLDTDVVLCTEVVRRGCELVKDQCVMVPPVLHGYSPHHMDFPGTISVNGKTFIDYVLDITKSLAHHGFERILLVNGHGSNTPFLEVVARLTVVETNALCASTCYWALQPVREVANAIRESPSPGGMAHACEFETSLYLAIRPELVQMDKAVDERPFPPSRYFWIDLISGGQGGFPGVSMMDWWSSFSKSGVLGDATKGTREKGIKLLEAAARGLAELIVEFRNRPRGRRVDHHRD